MRVLVGLSLCSPLLSRTFLHEVELGVARYCSLHTVDLLMLQLRTE